MLKYSLLSESLFQVDLSGKQVLLSLPEVLSRLAAREDLSFTHLRPHQRAPWHAFLVQLAYLALEGDDDPALPDTADAWARCLRDLTSGHDDDAPWCLINSDWQRPAFLQPACSPGSEADYKRSAESAQDIDVLVTSRHHDEKTGKLPLDAGTLDALVYALITLQGWSSFLGAGNYNSMRMNGGFSSRPQFRVAFERGTGAEFCRDVSVLLETRDELDEAMAVQGVGSGREVPHALLWLLPWNGGSLPLADVHPLCLEVCRRVRMVEDDGRLMLRRAGSSTMRIAAKDARGAVLDPWVPLIKGDPNRALTAQAHTLNYQGLQALLFDKERTVLPTLAKPANSERRSQAGRSATFIAQVLVSGDGGTDGLLRRELPMPPPVVSRFATADAALGTRSRKFVELADQASGKAYRSALLQFIDGSDEVDWKNRDFSKAVQPWTARYEAAIDEAFFSQLFGTFEQALEDTAAQRQWARWLAATAQDHLRQAAEALPTRDESRVFAHTRAQRLLHFSLRKQFGSLLVEDATA